MRSWAGNCCWVPKRPHRSILEFEALHLYGRVAFEHHSCSLVPLPLQLGLSTPAVALTVDGDIVVRIVKTQASGLHFEMRIELEKKNAVVSLVFDGNVPPALLICWVVLGPVSGRHRSTLPASHVNIHSTLAAGGVHR